jgi:arylsulfatase A-like enzyme
MRRLLLPILPALGIALLALVPQSGLSQEPAGCGLGSARPWERGSRSSCAPRPNFIVILTDDQRWDTIPYMPAVSRLADEGVLFTNSFVPTPVCGPSRASLLTGRRASTQGIFVNEGAAAVFDPSDTIAVRLQEQGYVTALFGKYLNGYRDLSPAVPPGWNEWRVLRDRISDLFSPGSLYVDPVLSWNGEHRRQQGYSTDFLTDFAVEFIEENASRNFFLLLSFFAPHVPLKAAERHQGVMEGRAPDPPPSLAEEDLSDKPAKIQAFRDLVGDPALLEQFWEESWPRYLEVLLGVDDAVSRILETLEELGLDENTVVIFTSDNGFLFGEHWWLGKGVPYEESIRVPLVVWYPGRVAPGRSDALVQNIDIAPTLAALAGAQLSTDGSSLVPLLLRRRAPWRKFVRLEWWETMGITGYLGFRFKTFKFVAWEDDHLELYGLRRDPYELENRLGRRPPHARTPPISSAGRWRSNRRP